MKAKRSILRIQLDRGAKESLERLCQDRGMTQIAVMSRLVDWFIQQDEIVQLGVLGVLSPDLISPLARRLLERKSVPDSAKKRD
jgi:hypothetical protein